MKRVAIAYTIDDKVQAESVDNREAKNSPNILKTFLFPNYGER